jgi:hypothetical protein
MSVYSIARLAGGAFFLATAGSAQAAQSAATDIVLGTFHGTGRACYGTLTIGTRHIAWMTPFSQCARAGYAIREEQMGPEGLRVVYLLDKRSAHCLYSALILTRRADADAPIGWNVVGYQSLQSNEEKREDDGLAYYLWR